MFPRHAAVPVVNGLDYGEGAVVSDGLDYSMLFLKFHNQATPDRQEPGHTDNGTRTQAHRASNGTGMGSYTPLTTQDPNPQTATQPAAVRPTHDPAPSQGQPGRQRSFSMEKGFFSRERRLNPPRGRACGAARVDTQQSKPATDNREWTPIVASTTAHGHKCPGRAFPDHGPKKKPQCCAATRRSKAAGSIKRPAGKVRKVGPRSDQPSPKTREAAPRSGRSTTTRPPSPAA